MKIAVVFDIDGVLRDVSHSYRRALADTVEAFTQTLLDHPYRPSMIEIDQLKQEGLWNNDWLGSQELIYRWAEKLGKQRQDLDLDLDRIVEYFENRYRGQSEDPDHWDGYVTTEPLLVDRHFFQTLTKAEILWGFFSGANRSSALYVLSRRLGIIDPVLFAMEDGPEKPDPTGLIWVVNQLAQLHQMEINAAIYCGDTNADMLALVRARQQAPQYQWCGVGIIPPHLWDQPESQIQFSTRLRQAGADQVLERIRDLDPVKVQAWFEG